MAAVDSEIAWVRRPPGPRGEGILPGELRRTWELHRSHVSLLERGRIKITVNSARLIAQVLEISLAELFRGDGLSE